jgi:hypothetical protein
MDDRGSRMTTQDFAVDAFVDLSAPSIIDPPSSILDSHDRLA